MFDKISSMIQYDNYEDYVIINDTKWDFCEGKYHQHDDMNILKEGIS